MIDGNTKQTIKISLFDLSMIISFLLHYRRICNEVDSGLIIKSPLNDLINELYNIRRGMYKDETIDITGSNESFHR